MARRLKADRLFDGKSILEGKHLVLDDNGAVLSVSDDRGEEAEQFAGLLCPGFINSHCHLELSHLKDKVRPGTGMVDFLISVVYARRHDTEKERAPLVSVEKKMWADGISGVADICNTTETIPAKKTSRISWYGLVEVINFLDDSLEIQLPLYQNVLDEFNKNGLTAVLTPHAPYSVSAGAFTAIDRSTRNAVISVHNQESRAENDLFLTGNSDFLRLYAEFGDGNSPFAVTGKSSLQSWLPHFTNGQTIVLVHNTFIDEADIDFAADHASAHGLTLVYCICPNANLYIEGRLPPLDLLVRKNCRIVIGTDSYSSNRELSIARELYTLQQHFPEIKLEDMLKWATSNGADTFKWDHLGSFKTGTKPGVILLDEKDLSVKRIL